VGDTRGKREWACSRSFAPAGNPPRGCGPDEVAAVLLFLQRPPLVTGPGEQLHVAHTLDAPYAQGISTMGEIDPEGDVPVYQQLAAILREQIDSGQIPPRRAIPSKKMLVQTYGVAPGTVERALGVLKQAGYLKTVLGRGLHVVAAEDRPR
jgi:Bacterial regulatory proteins, gntR family